MNRSTRTNSWTADCPASLVALRALQSLSIDRAIEAARTAEAFVLGSLAETRIDVEAHTAQSLDATAAQNMPGVRKVLNSPHGVIVIAEHYWQA